MTILRGLRREIRRLRGQATQLGLRKSIGNRWNESQTGRAHREYPDYETYLKHQRTKLEAFRTKSIERHDVRFYNALRERLETSGIVLARRRVICLAARQGSEVRAFTQRGAFAVGIDLNPGPDNRYVLVGDFHDLQFATGVADVVFTNSLDHVFDLGRVIGEVSRVLIDGGLFVTEVGVGTLRGTNPGFYESFSWQTVDELVVEIERRGFRLAYRSPFEIPWVGEHLQFVRVENLNT